MSLHIKVCYDGDEPRGRFFLMQLIEIREKYPFDLHAGRHSGTETTVKASELYGKKVLRV